MKPAPDPQYFTSSSTGALYRRTGGTDACFTAGRKWLPTETIHRYMVGRDDDVTPMTEDEARAAYPAAFS